MYKLVKETDILKDYGFIENTNFSYDFEKQEYKVTPNGQYLKLDANLIIFKNKRVAIYGKGVKFNNEFYKTLYKLIKDEVIEWIDENEKE